MYKFHYELRPVARTTLLDLSLELVFIISANLKTGQSNLKKNKTSCQALWSPVCGTDEKTYSNTCFLCLAIVQQYGACRY
uniref:Kazal-like domain-containing protein n=1 Tax=Laticauda laticaudata TaxID=8630 RepID=A0A8C5SFP6_LATLA